MKKHLLGAAAAGVLAIAAFATASPAAADARFGVYVGPSYSYPPPPIRGPRECWQWSYRLQDWVWVCRVHAYRTVPAYPIYPVEPVYPTYGPYAYGPSFGFSFESGDHHHRHMH
jgi:hypothetical protein